MKGTSLGLDRAMRYMGRGMKFLTETKSTQFDDQSPVDITEVNLLRGGEIRYRASKRFGILICLVIDIVNYQRCKFGR